jgi:hypothetical protein
MSATATLRPAPITARGLENRALENRALENRFFEHQLSSKFFRLADRLWLAEIEDAASLLDLEEHVLEVIEDRLY